MAIFRIRDRYVVVLSVWISVSAMNTIMKVIMIAIYRNLARKITGYIYSFVEWMVFEFEVIMSITAIFLSGIIMSKKLTVHLLGLSPVWTRMWISSLYLALKGLWSRLQSLQKQVKSSPLRWSIWFLSTCFTRSSLLSHILSQSIHWHCVTCKVRGVPLTTSAQHYHVTNQSWGYCII